MKYLPQIIVILTVLAFAIAAIYDWKAIMHAFKMLIVWVKEEPFKAGAVLILVYTGLIILSMPIVFLSIPLGYAFH